MEPLLHQNQTATLPQRTDSRCENQQNANMNGITSLNTDRVQVERNRFALSLNHPQESRLDA